jgi:DNA-binding NarL/FixJ family response regulator
MSSAFANPISSPVSATERESRVAVVAGDDSCCELAALLVTGLLRQWTGIVATHDIADLVGAQPDAVVLVSDFSKSSTMATLRRVRSELPAARVVVVAHDDSSAIAARQALNAGAEAFVPADGADQTLAPALDAVMAGLICAPRAARRLVAKPTFSHREKEVLELLVAGLTNREIGARLFLAESTVKTHVASAFAKLGVRSRKDAVALLLDPAEGLATTALPPAPSVPQR